MKVSTKTKAKVMEITLTQLKMLIDEAVEDRLAEILGDPDRGLEFSDDMKRQIEESLAAFKKGARGVALEDLAKEMGIELE